MKEYLEPQIAELMAEESVESEIDRTKAILLELQQTQSLERVLHIIAKASGNGWEGVGAYLESNDKKASLSAGTLMQLIIDVQNYIEEFSKYIELYHPNDTDEEATKKLINIMSETDPDKSDQRDAVLKEIRSWREQLAGQVGGMIRFKGNVLEGFHPEKLDKTEFLYIIQTAIINAIQMARGEIKLYEDEPTQQ